jgi:hypothetical protein
VKFWLTIPGKGLRALISGKADERNPATLSGDAIVSRLNGANYRFPFEHLAYDDAGHNIGRPYRVTGDAPQGTPAGNASADEQSWQAILQFLDRHLGRRGGQ